MHQPNSFFSHNPWSWKELVSLLALTFLFVPIFIEYILMNALTKWFQNDLYSGTITGLMMAIIFTISVYYIALRPQGLSWKAVGIQMFPRSYWGWTLLWYIVLVIGATIIALLVEMWFGMGTENSKTESLLSRLSAICSLPFSLPQLSPLFMKKSFIGAFSTAGFAANMES